MPTRMKLNILLGFRDDLDLNQRAEIGGGLRGGEGDFAHHASIPLNEANRLRAVKGWEQDRQERWRTCTRVHLRHQVTDAIGDAHGLKSIVRL